MPLQLDAGDADLAVFLEEAAEQIKTLSDGLLRMERDTSDTHLLQAVFRAAHTLKGSAATIGHGRMAALTHAMESVLDGLRTGTLTAGTPVIDALLACVDALTILNEEAVTRVESDIAVDTLVARLGEVAGARVPAAPAAQPGLSTADHAAIEGLLRDGCSAFEVEVSIAPASDWPAVRAYQALMELASLGTVIRSWPSEQQLQGGEGGHTLSVVLLTERGSQAVQEAAGSVSEVSAVAVRGVTAPGRITRTRQDEGSDAAAQSDRRRVDLGPETRGASIEEQLVVAGTRLTVAARMVKVDIARLDALMNLVGELVIDRGRLVQVLRELSSQSGMSASLEHLAQVIAHLSRLSDDLQQQVMLSRLLPVDSVFSRFPRMVRDLARRSGKTVRFVIEGEQTGLDRSVIDEIGDPLLHLLRNALDHGVETPAERRGAGKPEEALLLLAAHHEEGQIVLEVRDDGRGIDPQAMRDTAVRKGILSAEAAARISDDEAIALIFAPGFSSIETATDVSGRGVGMDIVRTNIEKLNGTVTVATRVGEGTSFIITLPLTLAIIPALLVRVGEATFTIPLVSVQETLRVRADTIRTVQRREMVLVRGQVLPLVRLAELFARADTPAQRAGSDTCSVVAVRTGRSSLGLVVDALVGEQEVVIKPMGGVLTDVDGIAGATILGDGRVSMILDVPTIVERLAPAMAA